MRMAKDDVNVMMAIPGATVRLQPGFGDVKGYDKISGEYFTLAAGVDTTPLFQGLDGNACQCPHWGFVLRGVHLLVWALVPVTVAAIVLGVASPAADQPSGRAAGRATRASASGAAQRGSSSGASRTGRERATDSLA